MKSRKIDDHAILMTRSAIARLAFVKRRLLEGGDHVNCLTLAMDYECCHRTIVRDVTFLRDRLGHQISYDHRARSLRYVVQPEPVL